MNFTFEPPVRFKRMISYGDQDVAVRAFIYENFTKTEFTLHFTDLKFSQPVRLAHGCGDFIHKNTKVYFEVTKDRTILKCKDDNVLESLMVLALDKYCQL
jgi:hypothetical protein